MLQKIKSGILGLSIGDAVGVPVEFKDRTILKSSPVSEMTGYGTYNLPAGSWSDDTSMTLALLDTLKPGFEYSQVMDAFKAWMKEGKYTPWGEMFDIGNTCSIAINRYIQGANPVECGPKDVFSNGNGSLMRILPAAFYIKSQGYDSPFDTDGPVELINNLSALTHGHDRSKIACCIYISCAMALMDTPSVDGLKKGLSRAWAYFNSHPTYILEFASYKRIYSENFRNLTENEIKSSGYVVDTLESALWCIMNTSSYKECILKAVNLGHDTDTTAAVAGGLAGLLYGLEGIPDEWMDTLVNRDYIEKLCEKFYGGLS